MVRDGEGGVTALARRAEDAGNWRTLFYGFPLETLPPFERRAAFDAGLGWLSPLGVSTWSVTSTTPLPGERVTATAVLHNDAVLTHTVHLSHTVPASLTLVAPPSDSAYDPGSRRLSWSGEVPAGDAVTLTWQADVISGGSAGAALSPRIAVGLPAWGLTFTREAPLRVAGAELTTSDWRAPAMSPLVREPLTLTFAVRNTGPGTLESGNVRLWLSPGLAPITATLQPTTGTSLPWWSGTLAPGATRELTIAVRPWRWEPPLRLDALLDDGTGRRWERALWLAVDPHSLYLPLIYKTAP